MYYLDNLFAMDFLILVDYLRWGWGYHLPLPALLSPSTPSLPLPPSSYAIPPFHPSLFFPLHFLPPSSRPFSPYPSYILISLYASSLPFSPSSPLLPPLFFSFPFTSPPSKILIMRLYMDLNTCSYKCI